MLRAQAQMHVVKKPETVVRAVGVYEWTGDESKPTASRLVPVTLFIDGHLEDAGVYLARPVPFALETGTIFELDRAGVPEGTLELSFARRLEAAGGQFDDGWMGFGPYKPLPKPKLVAEKKSGPLSKIEVSGGRSSSGPKFSNKTSSDTADDDSGRPTMKRKTDSVGAGSSTSGSGTGTAGSGSAGTSTAGDDDPDRPTMTRRTDSSGSAAGTSDSSKASTSDPDSDAERPTLRKRDEAQRQAARKQHDSSSVSSVGNLNDDPDRPSLHRGKPPGAMGEDDLPALIGLPADLHQRIAVSDAVNRSPHDFARAWADDAECASVLQKLQDRARAKLAAYNQTAVASSGQASPPAAASAPAKSTTAAATRTAAGRRKAAAKAASPSPIELKDEVLKAYTLSYGGDPTYFYSATSTGADGVPRYVSVVAQQEPMGGELKVALASVTDAQHLDRTPQYRLVDVVDVEASNRASLLMELRAQHSRQFALYRVIGAQAQQTFVTGSTE
jgi:hypothetical protein